MSALAVDRAIRRRFAEAYAHIPGLTVLEEDPFPEVTNTAFLVGDGGDGAPVSGCQPLQWQFPRGANSFERVLVFLENENGHHYDNAHHVSFQNVRTRWRTEEGSSGIDEECCGFTTATNSQGETVYGPDLIKRRPQAEPESLYYDFHIVSRNYSIAQELLDVVKGMFPYQGFLNITFRDGSEHAIDMLRTTDAYRSSPFDATLTPGDPGVRRFRWTMQYEVESYTDNTLLGEWKQTIRAATCCEGLRLDLLPREGASCTS